MRNDEQVATVDPKANGRGAQVVIKGKDERGKGTSRTVHALFQFERTETTGEGRRAKTTDWFRMIGRGDEKGKEDLGLYPIEHKVATAKGGAR